MDSQKSPIRASSTTSLPGVQQRPLLFVHRDSEHLVRTSTEAQAIAAHLAGQQRQWKRIRKKSQKKIELHASTGKILAQKQDLSTISRSLVGSQSPQDGNLYCPHGQKIEVILDLGIFLKRCDLCPRGPNRSGDVSIRLVNPEILIVGDTSFNPFEPAHSFLDPEVRHLTYLYMQIINPFAKSLFKDWFWFDDVSQIQSSPVLAYAIAAFSSAFFTGMKRGAQGVVLPPPVEQGQAALWSIPSWLRLQTQCVTYLSHIVGDKSKVLDDVTFHTVIFLLRLAVLLGDGETARVHLKALQRMMQLRGVVGGNLGIETSVSKVNLISAFLHKPAIVIKRSSPQAVTSKEHLILDHDKTEWVDESEWIKTQNMLAGRLLIWSPEPPGMVSHREVLDGVFRMDPTAYQLDKDTFFEINRCYQIALFLFTYLNGVNFQPSLPRIRHHLLELKRILASLDLSTTSLHTRLPYTIFNLNFAGAFASRGFAERAWFVSNVATTPLHIQYMHELFDVMSKFTDPASARIQLLEELWQEVLDARLVLSLSKLSLSTKSRRSYLYLGKPSRPMRGPRPITRSPDLKSPIRLVSGSPDDAG